MSEQTSAAKPKVTITLSGVRQDLREGLTRAQIGEKYGLDKQNLTLLFQTPELKGARTRPHVTKMFEFVVDEPVKTKAAKKVAKVEEAVNAEKSEAPISDAAAAVNAAPEADDATTKW